MANHENFTIDIEGQIYKSAQEQVVKKRVCNQEAVDTILDKICRKQPISDEEKNILKEFSEGQK